MKDINSYHLSCKRNSRKLVLIIICSVICMFYTSHALAVQHVIQDKSIFLSKLDESIDSGELERYIDTAFNNNMKKYNIPGAVISIVKDGEIILSKGYGYADLEEKIPVVPDKTLFRIASVTKLFTASAAMQMVEKGKVDLNEDVNKYLNSFEIKNTYNKKITMAHLLTHTSGIDSDVIGDLSEKESETKPVSGVLKKRMLPVVREPGQYIQYSNYGMALAACIVEEVSGMNCAKYIDKNIFVPLEMTNTSFKMNLPELAKGYVSIGETIEPREMKGYFNLYPVGGIISTADDMAKFMMAHLNNGEYNGKRILKKDTAILMHSRQAGFDSKIPGTCYGFCEGLRNGLRTIRHPGYSPDGFSTEVSLFPDYNIGIFVSVNQGSNNSFPQYFVNDFIDHYYPSIENNTHKISFSSDINKNVEGTYRFGEYTRSTLNKGDIFGTGEDVKISVNKDGSITVNEIDPFTGKESITSAVQITKMVFRKSNGEYIIFEQGKGSDIAYMAQTSNSWHGTYERINWYDENFFQIGLFIVCIIVFLLEIMLWIVFSVRCIIKKYKENTIRFKIVRYVYWIVGVNSLLNIMFFIISMMTWGERLRYGIPLDAKLILIIPIINTLISIVLAVYSVVSWKCKHGSLFFRINTSAVAVICLVFVWIYNYWNLLGFRY